MKTDSLAPILIDGQWRPASVAGTFCASNPSTGDSLLEAYPVSEWSDIDAALDAALCAHACMRSMSVATYASFLRAYADEIESKSEDICGAAALETGYALSPRLKDIELPRTTGQLRLAAAAAMAEAWRLPTVDKAANIGSVLESLGPVAVFGPINFPLAYNGISGGDFAAAIAAGCPVIAKAHPCHPTTSRLLAQCAQLAADAAGMPAGTVQMVYEVRREDGLRWVADRRLGAAAFTGSRQAGLALKASADAVGKPIFLEMSSVNPVVLLPGALEDRFNALVDELVASALMATGQFCTNPGLVFAIEGERSRRFLGQLAERYAAAPCGTLLGKGTELALDAGIKRLIASGAELITGGTPAARKGYAWSNTLLCATGARFLEAPGALQTEAFGNATLIVLVDTLDQLVDAIACCEGSLTGCIYSATDGRDDGGYDRVAPILRARVGRLLNDKMPTGVVVSPAMNHGGPFPATGHPHFTSVGLPASMRRFTRLACYDHVRPQRLPAILRDAFL